MNAANHDPNREDLLALIAGCTDGTSGPDNLAKLEQLLLHDSEARTLYRRYLSLDEALRAHGQSVAPHWIAHVDPAPVRSAGRLVPLAVLATCVAATALVLAFLYRPAGATDIAWLRHARGDVRILGSDGQVRAVTSGLSIRLGDTVRTRGGESSTVVAYADGSRLTLVGDTSITCGDGRAKSVVVHAGTLSASVQPQPRARPMLLATPDAQMQVLGTRFQIEAQANRTGLSVTEGRVRVTRTSDGESVDVPDGKRAVVTAQNSLVVEEIPGLSATWEVDFERGLPAEWDKGVRVTEGLPAGSRGGVRSEPGDFEDLYNISSNEAWLQGLFAVRKTSHLHVTFKMERPGWMNVLIVTRTADPDEPLFSGNYLFKDFPVPGPGEWHTVSIPLAAFARIHAGAVPLEEVVPYKVTFFSQGRDRGLVIDRVWVTADGPGEVESIK